MFNFDDVALWCANLMMILCAVFFVVLLGAIIYGFFNLDSIQTKTCTVTITFNQDDGKNVLEKVESCSYGDK